MSALIPATVAKKRLQPLPLHDIQKLVLQGYDLHRSRYFVLTVANAKLARQFLTKLADEHWLTTAEHHRDHVAERLHGQQCPVSLGLTFKGLVALELNPRYQAVFKNKARAFAEGAHFRAAAHLADTGNNAAAFWKPEFQPDKAHVLLTLHADTQQALAQTQKTLQDMAGSAFEMLGWHNAFEGQHLEETAPARKARRVHFGMLDGISQVRIHGATDKAGTHEPGELLLGHANDEGFNAWRLATERPDLSGTSGLSAQAQSAKVASFFKNASFCAFRPMRQYVTAFQQFLDTQASEWDVSAEYLRAKLLGRWDNGQVIRTGETSAPVAQAGRLDDFKFKDDPAGLGCPFGAHIRRMNPRDDGVVPTRRRPIVRRGMPYGPAWTPAEPNGTDLERGLLGLFFCASLEDQFEHLLSEWANANPMGVPNKGTAKDPLIGNHSQPHARFDIPQDMDHDPLALQGFTPFVRTEGTLYAFFPGLHGLHMMNDSEVFGPRACHD